MAKTRLKKGISKNKPNILANVSSRKYDGKINFSFSDLDVSQHHQEDFKSWDKENLLLNLLNRIKDITCLDIEEAKRQNIIKVYPSFPPNNKTQYKVPSYLNEQLQWCVAHIQGKEVIAGHIIENTFYVVFLDKEHHFWISDKKHT
jgi:hypothetical protein